MKISLKNSRMYEISEITHYQGFLAENIYESSDFVKKFGLFKRLNFLFSYLGKITEFLLVKPGSWIIKTSFLVYFKIHLLKLFGGYSIERKS